jgi:hypothetical protein
MVLVEGCDAQWGNQTLLVAVVVVVVVDMIGISERNPSMTRRQCY